MNSYAVNLAQLKFWMVVLLAMFTYVPLTRQQSRVWGLTALNILFLKLYLASSEVIAVLADIALVFLVINIVPNLRFGTAATICLFGFTILLFVVYKFPARQFLGHDNNVLNVLAMLSYSYITIRILDMLREVSTLDCRAPSFPETVNYLIPFHMLAAGPVQSYSEFLGNPSLPRNLTATQSLHAIERITLGVFKKYVMAMLLKRLFLSGFTIGGSYFFIEAQMFYIWLYLDFSGLSDIAKGIGDLIGVGTPENFNHPFLARNMIDFWERWHISFSQFIRRNIFIPLQVAMMRKTGGLYPLPCASFALGLSFLLCGLWHHIDFPGLLWGIFHAIGVISTNLYRDRLTRLLGPKGVRIYLANRWIRIAATIVTFEYVALTLAIVGALAWK